MTHTGSHSQPFRFFTAAACFLCIFLATAPIASGADAHPGETAALLQAVRTFGDNVLAQVPDATAFLDHFAATRAAFCVTFSAGVGASAREAHAALKTAKEAAPGAIVRAERSSKRVEFRRRTVKGTWVALG